MTDPLRKWQYATIQRVKFAIRDWQKANRISLSKEAADDLLDRFASAMNDAVEFGKHQTQMDAVTKELPTDAVRE